jgi:hypothetical protein
LLRAFHIIKFIHYSLLSVVTNVSVVVDMSNPAVAPVLVVKAGPPIAKGSPPIGAV